MTSGHTVTIAPGTNHVEVHVDGEKLAESDRPLLLEETGLPTRYYLPREDVALERFRKTSFHTACRSRARPPTGPSRSGARPTTGSCGATRTPIPGAEAITDHLSFYPDRAEVTVDGATLS